jgi:hypothetical protein
MKKILQFACALALSLAGSTAFSAPISEPEQSTEGIRSFDLSAEQKGSFELSFDATPLADKIDCFTGIAESTPRRANDVAVIVRFNDSGVIDARNGNSFAADQKLGYASGRTYRVRMVVDMTHKTYSVFVAPAGEAEVALAKNYAFRSGQGSARSLGKLVLAGYKGPNGFAGGHRVSGISLKPAP